MKNYKYLFGPVPSRRFGRSLGVDLTPYKTCSFDCIFCQLGRTTRKTLTRKEYVPVQEVIQEINHWLKTDGNADYITLSGSGEPTLHSRFGEVLEFIRRKSTIPALLLTNGTMLYRPEVRAAAAHAGVVKISLSAWDQRSYEHINRPHPKLKFKQLVEGQRAFRQQFKGRIWMEVFILWGVNSAPNDVEKIAALARTIGPDQIQLNTAIRPPAEEFAVALPGKRLEKLAKLFDPPAEVIAEFSANRTVNIKANEKTILAMLQRRPCTDAQIAESLGMHRNEVSKYIGKLMRTDQLRSERKGDNVYYLGNSRKEISHADV